MKINPLIWGLALGFLIFGPPFLFTDQKDLPLSVFGVLLGIGTVGLAIAYRERWAAIGLAAAVGFLLADVVLIIVDSIIGRYDHTLFPIEMVIFFILGLLFAMPGALLGFLAGRFLGASERLGKAVAGLAVLASFALTLYRVL